MNALNQLVLGWLDCADNDEQDLFAAPMPDMKNRLRGQVMTRRNCAWELQRILRELDKENPPSGGDLTGHGAL